MYTKFVEATELMRGEIFKVFPRGGALVRSGKGKVFFLQGVWGEPKEKIIFFFEDKIQKGDKGFFLSSGDWIFESDLKKWKEKKEKNLKENKIRRRKERISSVLEKNKDWVVKKYYPIFTEEALDFFEKNKQNAQVKEKWVEEGILVLEGLDLPKFSSLKKILYFDQFFFSHDNHKNIFFKKDGVEYQFATERGGFSSGYGEKGEIVIKKTIRKYSKEEKNKILEVKNHPVISKLDSLEIYLGGVSSYSNSSIQWIYQTYKTFNDFKKERLLSDLVERVEWAEEDYRKYDFSKKPIKKLYYRTSHQSPIRWGNVYQEHRDVYFYGKKMPNYTDDRFKDFEKEDVDQYIKKEYQQLQKLKEILTYLQKEVLDNN